MIVLKVSNIGANIDVVRHFIGPLLTLVNPINMDRVDMSS